MTSPTALSPRFRAILQAQPTRTMECIKLDSLSYFKSEKLPAIYVCQFGKRIDWYDYYPKDGMSGFERRDCAWEELKELCRVANGSETRIK